MTSVENKTFQSESVPVDGQEFKSCTFNDATLVYGGGALPTFVNCQFSGVSLHFEGAAGKTLQFLSGLSAGGFAPAVEKIVEGVRSQRL